MADFKTAGRKEDIFVLFNSFNMKSIQNKFRFRFHQNLILNVTSCLAQNSETPCKPKYSDQYKVYPQLRGSNQRQQLKVAAYVHILSGSQEGVKTRRGGGRSITCTPVGIGLTDLPKYGGIAPTAHRPVPTALYIITATMWAICGKL